MPLVAETTANTTAQTLFTTPDINIGKILVIEIINNSASDITITLNDVFTPSPSVNNPSPTETTEKVFEELVKAGATYKLELDKNKAIEVKGQLQAVANVTDTACKIRVLYDFE